MVPRKLGKIVWFWESFVEIGQLVPEKIFEGCITYMGMAAILVM